MQRPTNFVYDTWVYLGPSAANIGNLELDLNQVMPNGHTVIYGMQCDGYSLTWDYNAKLDWTAYSQKPVDAFLGAVQYPKLGKESVASLAVELLPQ